MAELSVSPSFKNELQNILNEKAKEGMGLLLAEFFRTVMAEMPVEDGHGHEAWLAALSELSGEFPRSSELGAVYKQFRELGSKDPKANQAGTSGVDQSKNTLTVSVRNGLPFVEALNYGRQIRVGDWSGNRGPKDPITPKVAGVPSPLYGPRKPQGRGLLVYFDPDTGQKQYKLFRIPRAYGFFENALARVRQKAQSTQL